jgi:YD repeat-containing protein
MKKLFYLLVFSSLPVCILHAQTRTNDLVSENLNGYVKSVNVIKFEAAEKFGDITKGEKTARDYEAYNKSGFRTEFLMKDYKDDSEWTCKFTYDGNNNLIETDVNDEGEIEISKRKFNDRRNVEVEDTYNKKGNLTGRSKFIYNNSGLLTKVNQYDANGKLTFTVEDKYNENNQLISSLSYDEPRKLLYSSYYKYDMRGNVIEDISGSRNKKGAMDESTKTFRFNGKKQKTEETYSSSGGNPTKTTYEYDTNGNLLVKKDSYNQDTYTYTYDKQNNWTKRIKSHLSFGTTTFEITEREIKYYDIKDIPAGVAKKEETINGFFFDDLIFETSIEPVETSLWRFIYTKGETFGKQKRRATKVFPENEIKEDQEEGYYITDLSYGGNANDKYWVMIVSKTKYTDQVWKLNNNKEELEASIRGMRKGRPDLFISKIAYGDGKWVVVSSKGTGYTDQVTVMRVSFPETAIKEYGGKDYTITDMAYGGGLWVVTMSKGTNTSGQHYSKMSTWDQKLVDENASKSYYLTETAKHENNFYMVFTKKANINHQDIEATATIPDKEIISKWGKGYELSGILYY